MVQRRRVASIDGVSVINAKTTPYRRTKYANYSRRRTSSEAPKELVTVHIVTSNKTQATQKLPKLRQAGMNIAAGIVFLVGIGASVNAWLLNNKVDNQSNVLAEQIQGSPTDGTAGLDDNQAPSEDLGQDYGGLIASHTVPPDQPKLLSIPSIGVHARVRTMGRTSSGAVQAPNNIFDVGWYTDSALPGKLGATFIDGHVHGISKPGVFYNLKNLQPGDEVQLTKGDGSVLTYIVVDTQNYPANAVDMKRALSPTNINKPSLNLMTCSGTVVGTDYQERLVVFTELHQ